MRAAISRRACSASARRPRATRDWSSSSISRVVVIVIEAWSAIAVRTAASVSSQASTRLAKTSVPRTALPRRRAARPSPSGLPSRLDVAVAQTAVTGTSVAEVVPGPGGSAGDDGLAGDALVERLVGVFGPVNLEAVVAGCIAQAQLAGRDRPGRSAPPRRASGGPPRPRPAWSTAGRSVAALIRARDLAQRAFDLGPLGQLGRSTGPGPR